MFPVKKLCCLLEASGRTYTSILALWRLPRTPNFGGTTSLEELSSSMELRTYRMVSFSYRLEILARRLCFLLRVVSGNHVSTLLNMGLCKVLFRYY